MTEKVPGSLDGRAISREETAQMTETKGERGLRTSGIDGTEKARRKERTIIMRETDW